MLLARPLALAAAALLALAGCFDADHPDLYSCSVEHPECPPGRSCVADRCVAAGDLGLADALLDLAGADLVDAKSSGCKKVDWIRLPPKTPATFWMGSPFNEPCRYPKDENRHQVTLTQSFVIMTTEVTVEQFKKVLHYNPAFFSTLPEVAQKPVRPVNWHRAVSYCNALSIKAGLKACYVKKGSEKPCDPEGYEKTQCPADEACLQNTCNRYEVDPVYAGSKIYKCEGYRLPTEAEWEYAYRAGTQTAFYNGEITHCNGQDPVLDKIAWYKGNSSVSPNVVQYTLREVAKKRPNAYCLYDMSGNVQEWVHDGYLQSLGSSPGDDPEVDPVSDPDKHLYRVRRSGHYMDEPQHTRGANREYALPRFQHIWMGFRVVRSVVP